MLKFSFWLTLAALVAFTSALRFSPFQQYFHHPEEPSVFLHQDYQSDPEVTYETDSPAVYDAYRPKRSLQPGAPNVPLPLGQNGGWSVNPTISGDPNGNTRTNVEVQHKGKDHDFNAGWGKVVRGPNKAKPTWHVGGSYRW